MVKNSDERVARINKLVKQISTKIDIEPQVEVKLTDDFTAWDSQAKRFGCTVNPLEIREDTAHIYISDEFFDHQNLWRRLLVHECGHIKTYYQGMPFFYLSEEEIRNPVLNSKEVDSEYFSNQMSKYENLSPNLFSITCKMFVTDIRIRIHDHLANKIATKPDFEEDFAKFADFELERFADKCFLEEPYFSKLITHL